MKKTSWTLVLILALAFTFSVAAYGETIALDVTDGVLTIGGNSFKLADIDEPVIIVQQDGISTLYIFSVNGEAVIELGDAEIVLSPAAEALVTFLQIEKEIEPQPTDEPMEEAPHPDDEITQIEVSPGPSVTPMPTATAAPTATPAPTETPSPTATPGAPEATEPPVAPTPAATIGVICEQCGQDMGLGNHEKLDCGHYACVVGTDHPTICAYCKRYTCNRLNHTKVCSVCGKHVCTREHRENCPGK